MVHDSLPSSALLSRLLLLLACVLRLALVDLEQVQAPRFVVQRARRILLLEPCLVERLRVHCLHARRRRLERLDFSDLLFELPAHGGYDTRTGQQRGFVAPNEFERLPPFGFRRISLRHDAALIFESHEFLHIPHGAGAAPRYHPP